MNKKSFRSGIGIQRKRAVRASGSDKSFKEQTNSESYSLIQAISTRGSYVTPTILIWKALAGHCYAWYSWKKKGE